MSQIRLPEILGVSLLAFYGTSLASGNEDRFTPPKMNVPEGFVVEVVAAPPLVKYPMMGCLDERGRMFIAETHGQNLDKKGLLKTKHRFIRMIEDTDRDGRFDKSTIFADGLVMPEGAVWYRGSLYVLSSPYLWRFEDTDDDGVADVREKLVGKMEFNGKANQHGGYVGPCGRMYFSGGTFGYSLVGSDGKPAYPVGKGSAAGVFSCRLDGSDVEIFATGGINPVEVAFSPEGEMFTTCPIIDNIGGRHDALIHWVRGATVGPKDFRPPPLPQTGYRLPPLSRWGQVAPSGLMMARSKALGKKYHGRLFATHFNTRTVISTRIERHGSTYRSFDEPFLTSPNPDFHPTDIMEDADGSLLMIDTGGWFRISCPFSKTAKPEIPGAIYRIRRVADQARRSADDAKVLPLDRKPIGDPRGLALNWKNPTPRQLWERLDDPRPTVRDRAISAWHERGNEGTDFLLKRFRHESRHAAQSSPQRRRNAIWAASRIGNDRSRRLIRYGLSDPDTTVRHAAARSAGILKDREAAEQLANILISETAAWSLRRACAAALGQIKATETVPALLSAAAAGGDDFFQHAVVYALIEIGDFEATTKGLAIRSPQVQRAALVALDRIDSAMLTQAHVAPLLETDDQRLRKTVTELISRRSGWSDQIIGFLDTFITQNKVEQVPEASVRGAIVNFSKDKRVQEIVAKALQSPATSPQVRKVILGGLARLPQIPAPWAEPIGALLDGDKATGPMYELIATLTASGTNQFDKQLRALADNESHAKDLRAAAWICLCKRGQAIPDSAVELLRTQVHCAAIFGPLHRLEAAQALASAKLTGPQLHSVAELVAMTGPIALPPLLDVFVSSKDQQIPAQTASILLDSLRKSPGLANLTRTQMEALLRHFPKRIAKQAAPLLKKLQAGKEKQTERLNAIAAKLTEGNVARGRKTFFSNQAACSACHRVAGQGGSIGPDLSRIGNIRKRRDLLEAIVLPSATIVNNYETWSVVTSTGRIHSGVIQRATAHSIVIRNAQRMEVELDRNDIDKMVRQPKSIMPQGLDRTLTSDELSDLIAFLKSLRKKND